MPQDYLNIYITLLDHFLQRTYRFCETVLNFFNGIYVF